MVAASGLLHSTFNQLPVSDVFSPLLDVALARDGAPYFASNDCVKHASDGPAVRCDAPAPNYSENEPRCRWRCRGG